MLFLFGFLAFLLAGMGLGGGLLLTPLLTSFCAASPEQARYMTLLGYLPAAAVSSVHVFRSGNARRALPLIPAGILGVLCGVCCSFFLPAPAFRRLFGLFTFAYGCKMACSVLFTPIRPRRTRRNEKKL